MRIEKLNSNKVKVTLSCDDLTGYDIDVQKLSSNSAELHNFLFRIMETIHKETGFNPYNGQIVVEAQSSPDGMCIIISKIGQRGKGITEAVKDGKKITARAVEKASGVGTYYFENFEYACEAISFLKDDVHRNSELYKVDNQYCYLLDMNNPCFENEDKLCEVISILREFSQRDLSYKSQHARVREYGCLVAKGESLVSMADNLRKINKI